MPAWWPWLALAVFVTHLPFFLWRWRQTGEARFFFTSLTFALLVCAYSLQLFAPELRIAEVELHTLFRRLAWACAFVSVSMLVAHQLRLKKKSPSS